MPSRLSSRPPLLIAHPPTFPRGIHLVACFLAIGLGSSFAKADGPSPKKIQQEARSILSNRCFACHGPDEAKVESGLRLDSQSIYTSLLESGKHAVVPGNPDASELMRRVASNDAGERMPPPQFGEKLTDRERQILKSWIEQGAELPVHWSFKPPQVPPMPAPDAWSNNPIDALALVKMHERGLAHSPEADRSTLLRRLTLDLTGLPPTLEELDDFVADDSPHAYQDAVERLLASPRFGEHWARKWLDLARYADSAGYADDPARTIWAYRDWVIQAINRNLPFDQFTREQLAGDLLPNPTQEQWIATAFHRNTLTNNEGGTNDEEFRNVAVVDRVNTTMAVWMGMTMACAQCHSHKYDPISQKEYFQIFAIFNQSQDADRRDESPTLDIMSDEQARDRRAWSEEKEALQKKLTTIDPNLAKELSAWESSILEPTQWLDVPVQSVATTSGDAITADASGIHVASKADRDTLEILLPLDAIQRRQLSGIQIETLPIAELPGGGAGAGNGNFVISRVAANLVKQGSSGVEGRYVRVELPGDSKILSLAEVEVLSRNANVATLGKATQSSTDFSGEASRAIDGNKSGVYTENSTTHTASSKDPWWEVDLKEPREIEKVVLHNRTDDSVFQRLEGAKVSILDGERRELWSQIIKKATKKPSEHEVVEQPTVELTAAFADYEQSGFAASGVLDQNAETGWAVGGDLTSRHTLSLATKPISEAIQARGLDQLRVRIECSSKHSKHVLASFRLRLTQDAGLRTKLSVPSEILSLVKQSAPNRSPEDQNKIAVHYQSKVASSFQPIRDQIASLTKKLENNKPATTVPIMRELERDKLRRTFIHIRGNSRAEGETVQAALPSAFHRLNATNLASHGDATSAPINRLQLAEWIMQADNPLTSRVIVNRFWESIFGLGLVRSSEDFGSQGDLPSHPELLDWLSTEFIRQQWDTKAILRMIVSSATYRQQSTVSPEQWEADQDNVYLSRGPRVRLSAEQVRDQALAVAGLLSHRMYGEPVRPKQPNSGLKAAFGSGTDWETSTGENSYRRGMYTVWRRSNPYPSMATFDAPNREVCALRRDRTNTPLQALVTLNDPVFVEAAQGFGRRVLLQDQAQAALPDQLRWAFRLATSRYPNDKELLALERLFEKSLVEFRANPTAAKKLAFDPIGPWPDSKTKAPDAKPPETEILAAWTVVANVLLNLDEVLMTK